MYKKFDMFPSNHIEITPDDSDTLFQEMLIYCGSDGDVAAVDTHGRVVVYTVSAGDILPILAVRINATDTTVTQIVGLY